MRDLTGIAAGRGVRRGEWVLSDGSLVGIPADGGDFYRNRGDRQVFLHRRNNAMGPLGCDVDTVATLNAIACVNISEQNYIIIPKFLYLITSTYCIQVAPPSQAITVEGNGILIAGQSPA